ncbi:Hypothetical predicted protein [Olea europaea subsp. europaea]|nr:Hypothetical predicted protein [Olea europaea subsp. europaea]
MSSLFVPSEENSFNLSIDGFEIRVNNGNRTNCALPSTNLHALIYLKCLQFVSFKFCVPSLELFFSSGDISVMLVFYTFLSKESKRARPGLQLWNIASSKIRSLLPTSASSLLKATKVACLWLRYVHTYQGMLQLVGYPMVGVMKKSTISMSRDKKYTRSVKFQWKLISEIEKELPTEVIALARRMVRSTVASHHSGANCSSKESLINIIFLKLHQLLVLIWATICSLLNIVTRNLSLHRVWPNHPKTSQHFGSSCEDSLAQCYMDLNIGEISISVTPENDDQHTTSWKAVSDIGFSYQDLLSFHLSIDACFLGYIENVSEKCFVFACGCWKVLSFSILKGSPKSYSKYLKGRGTKKGNDQQTVIWGEPAKMICPSEVTGDNLTNDIGATSISYLDLLLGKLWLNWKDSCSKSEAYIISKLQSPWILCEVRSSLTDDSLSDLSYGFWNCVMVVGRLNVKLEYLLVASIAVLLSQIQHSLGWDDCRRNFVSHTPTAITEDPPRDFSCRYSSYYDNIETTIMRMLPQKHVQIGVLISGPHVQLSLTQDQFYVENEEPHHLMKQATLNLHDIELVFSPNLDSNLASSGACSAGNDREPDYTILKVPNDIDITGSVNEIYSCQRRILYNAHLKFNGLNAYFEESSESQNYHIFELSPTTIQLQGLRKEHHSFGSTMIALSAASHWMATGFTTLIYMDELYILTEVIFGLYYDLSRAFAMLASSDDLSHQEASRQETFYADSGSEETFMARGGPTSLIITHVQMSVNNTCELKSFDIVIHNSRQCYSMENSSRVTGTKLAMREMPGHGIYISGPKLFMDVSFRRGNMDIIIDLSGFRSIIFRYPAEFEESLHKSEINNLLRSLNFLIEASISHIKLCFFLRTLKKDLPRASLSTAMDEPTSNSNALCMAEHSPMVTSTNAELGDHPVLATIALSEIYVSSCPVKDILAREHVPNKLSASFSVGEEFQTISCDSLGGFLLLEATSATMFAGCCKSYYNRILDLWHSGSSPGRVVPQYSEDKTVLDVRSSLNSQQLQHVTQDHLQEFSLNISHLFLIFVSNDESGRLQELLLEVDFHLNHKVLSTVKKVSLGISKFSMLSQYIHVTGQKPRDIQIHGFSSGALDDPSPNLISDGLPVLEQKVTVHSALADAGYSSPSSSQNDIRIGSSGGSVISHSEQKNVHLSSQNYILKEFKSFLAAEWPVSGDQFCPNKLWVGSGFISGFDLTISLTEIKILISAFKCFSEVFIREKTSKMEQRHWSSDQDSEGSAEEMVADGTIVAIQDVDQHMYIAVEDVESRYGIIGATHYSLVGERSLFRVKYYNARRWKSQVQYFSLISLYAKDNSGESLRLNCRPRQGLVDISCSNDSGCALWAALPDRPDHYGDDVELESFHPLVRRTFHLVNKKNDYAVAFIDGVLEFVSKPGNLFKWKVFHDPSPASNSLLPIRYLGTGSGANLQYDSNANSTKELRENGNYDSNANSTKELRENGNLSGITITIDKVTLTILHELSDTEGKLPLLQGSITSSEAILQISNTKVRVVNTVEVLLYYFDAQRSSWREFLHPLEICSFYTSKFLIQGSDNVLQRVQSHFYARIKEAIVSMNELSLDIILFVIGKLNLAGPYAVRSSVVLANCCKVCKTIIYTHI